MHSSQSSLSRLPPDLIRSISEFFCPYDFLGWSTVSTYIRQHSGMNFQQIEFGKSVIEKVRSIIQTSCPFYRPGSNFVIAGSFPAYLAAMQLGVSKSHINFGFNDIDVFYRADMSLRPGSIYEELLGNDHLFPHLNYERATREIISVQGHKLEVNWIPGSVWSVDAGPTTHLKAKDVVKTFDLSCVRVGFEVNSAHPVLRWFVCSSFFDFVESRCMKLMINLKMCSPYAQRSTAIRIVYKVMTLKAVGCTANALFWLLGGPKEPDPFGRIYYLKPGPISKGSAAKIEALKRAGMAMPVWFQHLKLEELSFNPRQKFFLTFTEQSTFWGHVVERPDGTEPF